MHTHISFWDSLWLTIITSIYQVSWHKISILIPKRCVFNLPHQEATTFHLGAVKMVVGLETKKLIRMIVLCPVHTWLIGHYLGKFSGYEQYKSSSATYFCWTIWAVVNQLNWHCCKIQSQDWNQKDEGAGTSPRIMPWLTKHWKGSFVETTPMSYNTCRKSFDANKCLWVLHGISYTTRLRNFLQPETITLCQKRAYSKCSTECSAPPTYKSTGPQYLKPKNRGSTLSSEQILKACIWNSKKEGIKRVSKEQR
jgi:hypothetical protein